MQEPPSIGRFAHDSKYLRGRAQCGSNGELHGRLVFHGHDLAVLLEQPSVNAGPAVLAACFVHGPLLKQQRARERHRVEIARVRRCQRRRSSGTKAQGRPAEHSNQFRLLS